MTKAIAGLDGPSQGAALQLASKVGGPAATKALADMLPKLAPAVQIKSLCCKAWPNGLILRPSRPSCR
jgi:hypothetical protein